MQSVEIQDSNKWNKFIQANALDGGLLQSWEWGEFKESLGLKVFKIGIEGEGLVGAALSIKHTLPLGKSYLYCPRGPIVKPEAGSGKEKILELLLNKIKEVAVKEKAMFLRMDPAWPEEEKEVLKNLGFVKLERDIQPKETLILDINKSEKEILDQMKQKTRYNIRLASKKGIAVKQLTNNNLQLTINKFWELLCQTAKRDIFKTHPKKYYEKMLKMGGSDLEFKLFLAEYQDITLGSILVGFFGEWAYYLHGGSNYQSRHLMAPYLLQWEAIKEAKKRNCLEYDFWGIKMGPNSNWEGITKFKRGFAPQAPITEYVGTWDLVYQPGWYEVYKKILGIKRARLKPGFNRWLKPGFNRLTDSK